MDMKEFMTDAELDKVVGGGGFLYYRQNGNTLWLFASTVPLNDAELKILASGKVPEIIRLNQKVRSSYIPAVEIGAHSKAVGDAFEELYGKFESIKAY